MNRRHLVLAGSAVLLLLPLACGLSRPSLSGPAPSKATDQSSKPAAVTPPRASSGAAAQAPAAVPPESQKVQRSAQVTLEVASGSFEKSLDRVVSLMRAQGGYISGSDAQADSGDRLRSGQVTFQVPADKFDSTIAGIRQIGSAQSIRIAGTDVSTQYVDLQARLRNAEAQRDAMLAILQRATSVSEVIQVQTQLGQITGQIEQLKGEIDYLDHTTAYATVSLMLREAAASTASDEWGLRTAAAQALHNFVNGIGVLLEVLGAVAPLVPFALLGWLLYRRLRRRPGAPTQNAG